jgi:hypothetical protein
MSRRVSWLRASFSKTLLAVGDYIADLRLSSTQSMLHSFGAHFTWESASTFIWFEIIEF